ncbi:Zn-ribbon domain-containing OB-fold protein [Martelella soudanensis]|uniref:Zn-ribbon domain-containing OB-fold protein n=1 Tax=unclassified Martelella TaxID=2629616 RepID=UPI0015DDD675|nr:MULTISPECIES: zinc ribbon domain-containing protein [unclassified Martelella]
MTSYDKPLPDLDDVHARPFWDHAARGELTIQRCNSCGDRHFPPTPICRVCLSETQSPEVVSGKGKILSWVTFHQIYWEG